MKTPLRTTLAAALWRGLLIGICCAPHLVAETAFEWPEFTTNAVHKAACEQQLRRIFEAIQAYRAKNGRLPDWLADLRGKYLAVGDNFCCPFVRTFGRFEDWRKGLRGEVFTDNTTSYSYEFCTNKLELFSGLSITCRDYKLRQREIVGDWVPIVRCIAHRPILNLSFGGRVYESGLYWEDEKELFKKEVGHDELTPTTLFAEEIRQHLRKGESPPRDPSLSPKSLDLSRHYNVSPAATWPLGGPENGLAELAHGPQKLDGIAWDVRGLIQLTPDPTSKLFPERIVGILVNQKCAFLHLLHGAVLLRPAEAGTRIGRYVVHYADGKTVEIPIIYGRDVEDSLVDLQKTTLDSLCKVAWQGPARRTAAQGKAVRLYHTRWQNPSANIEVSTIDFVSALITNSAPSLVAITLE